MLQGEVSCDVALEKIVFIPYNIIFQLDKKKTQKYIKDLQLVKNSYKIRPYKHGKNSQMSLFFKIINILLLFEKYLIIYYLKIIYHLKVEFMKLMFLETINRSLNNEKKILDKSTFVTSLPT